MQPSVCSIYLTHRGYIRSGNEDSILVAGRIVSNISMKYPDGVAITSFPALFCVADGIGGTVYGEIASRTVLESFLRYSPVPESAEEISHMVIHAKEVLDEIVLHDPSYTGFGTTVAGIILYQDHALVFNCGDSRVYLVDTGHIQRLSHDHSLVQELCDNGSITDEQVYTHPYRNIITSSVSGDLHRPAPLVTVSRVPLSGTAWFILCTDGVWEVVRDEALVSLCGSGDLEQAGADILTACLAGGGPDNISLILVGPC
ncbi:MAG: protein phosphatase 2C domain-containing protein [Methanobacteriota archaeon]